MSTISDFHDAIRARMQALFPDKLELSDNSAIENNDDLSLEDGWAVQFSTGQDGKRQVGCQHSIQRDIVITVTQRVLGGHKSIDLIASVEKQLLEDHLTIVNDFQKNENLGNIVVRRDYQTDTGIERVEGDSREFLMIRTTFQIEYFENFT
jgi:hypothetical protein